MCTTFLDRNEWYKNFLGMLNDAQVGVPKCARSHNMRSQVGVVRAAEEKRLG